MMDTSKGKKSTMFIAGLLLIFSLIALVLFSLSINNEVELNKAYTKSLSSLTESVEKLQHHVNYQNEYYNRLMTDEEFVRRIIKQKFEYTYPDEIVFKFKNGDILYEESMLIK